MMPNWNNDRKTARQNIITFFVHVYLLRMEQNADTVVVHIQFWNSLPQRYEETGDHRIPPIPTTLN